MDCALKLSSSSVTALPVPFTSPSSKPPISKNSLRFGDKTPSSFRIQATASQNGAVHPSASNLSSSSTKGDMHKRLSSLKSLFCYDKPVPEEIIEKPIGLSLSEKNIGDNSRCSGCQAKGAILCATCSGSGLYVDSIMESQGIIVKVRCLGCGGTGNIMCSECGGHGHCGYT